MEIMKDETVDEGVIRKANFFKVNNTIYHTQQRKNLRFYRNRLYFMNNYKVSVLDLKTGKIVRENFIPDYEYPTIPEKELPNIKKRKVCLFMLTKSFFIWSHERGYVLFLKHHDSPEIHHIKCNQGYQFNESSMSADEKILLTCGQTSVLSVYKVDRESGMELLKDECIDLGSFGNDVKFSKDERHVAVVTDGKGFQIFAHSPIGSGGKILTLIHGSNRIRIRGCCDMCEWSPDSKRLLVANSDNVVIFNLETSTLEQSVNVGRVSWVKWSPVRNDVFLYATHCRDACLVKYEISDGGDPKMTRYRITPFLKILKPDLDYGQISSCEFSSNGDRIFISYRKSRNYWYYVEVEEEEEEKDLGSLAQCYLSPKFRSLRSLSEKDEKQNWEDYWERRAFLFGEKKRMYRGYNEKEEKVEDVKYFFGLTICMGNDVKLFVDGIPKVFLIL